MPKSGEGAYLDSSALVKLVVHESETDALIQYLSVHPVQISCALARVEVVRAVRPRGVDAIHRASQVLRGLWLLHLDDPLLDVAARIDPGVLRSLDAIHLAAALTVTPLLGDLVTYDVRMQGAAERLGFAVVAPGSPV